MRIKILNCFKSAARSEKGISLVEVLVGLTILAFTGSAIFGSLQLSSKILLITDIKDTAKDLAEMQMEYVKGLPYATSYLAAPIPVEFPGYDAAIGSDPLRDGNIQKISVSIDHNGSHIITLEGYKVQW